MSTYADLTGKVFGRWKVESEAEYRNKHGWIMWNVVCECGNRKKLSSQVLKSGDSKSCGCLAIDKVIQTGKNNKTHGYTRTKIYHVWCNMRRRCEDEKNKAFPRYGGRGIKVCSRWHEFSNFLEDMGMPNEGETLDRIDFNGNYEKSNCRWATYKQQNNNRRDNRIFTHDGKTGTLSWWSEQINVNYHTLYDRIFARKWSIERSLSTQTITNQSRKKNVNNS